MLSASRFRMSESSVDSPLPPITMSRLDWDRIDALLESQAVRGIPGVDGLRRELDRALIVEPDAVPPDVATMDSTVRFIDEGNGHTFELTLVYPKDAGRPGTISLLAPVGSALLGLEVGQSIVWPMPGGRPAQLRVLAILDQPEAAGRDLG